MNTEESPVTDTPSSDRLSPALSPTKTPPRPWFGEQLELFDEDTAIMVCGHEGRFWSSEWRKCFACHAPLLNPYTADFGDEDLEDL